MADRYKVELHCPGVQFENRYFKTLKGATECVVNQLKIWKGSKRPHEDPVSAEVFHTADPSVRGAKPRWTLVQRYDREDVLRRGL